MPPCLGLCAHIELSRISNYVVCETFGIAPRNYSPSQSTQSIDTALKMLESWEMRLPASLQMPHDLNHSDPSCCILHMAHNQLTVLTTRPIFFAFVKQAVAQQVVRGICSSPQYSEATYIPACLTAAHRNLLLAERLVSSGQKLLQAGLHFVFNAAVILLLKRLTRSTRHGESGTSKCSTSSDVEEIEASISFAIETFKEEAKTGTHYPRDCCRVLKDLNALTERYVAWQDYIDLGRADMPNYAQPALMGGPHSEQPFDRANAIPAEMLIWMQNDGLQPQNSLFI
jgi:hypothetical protein